MGNELFVCLYKAKGHNNSAKHEKYIKKRQAKPLREIVDY